MLFRCFFVVLLIPVIYCQVDTKATELCKNRCNTRYDSRLPCQCNNQCLYYGNCCPDYKVVCDAPASCEGNCFISGPVSGSTCYCDAACSMYKNCCADYQSECTNETLCENRCFASYDSSKACQCNDLCLKYGNCCEDYYDQCLPGSCTGRCGDRNDTLGCQCDGTCSTENDCCEDFSEACTSDESCLYLCGSSYDSTRSCQCTDDCENYGNCCKDHESLCTNAGRYLCNGECDVVKEACSCMESCINDNTCCTDYQQSCKGGTAWVDDECTPAEEMVCPDGFDKPPVILFSMDGFRNSYLYRHISPNLWKIASCGVHSPYTRSIYPTKTFPNHYTIATGLYPESHGIVANRFYDHELDDEFQLGAPNSGDPHWWGGEPIWVTASNQGLKSASYFWVGSDVNITRYPDYYYDFDSSVPDEERMYQALKWMDLPPEERPSIMTLYIEEVDGAGHDVGPDGEKVNTQIKKNDEIVGMLMDGLKARGLDTCVNIIVLADHGMANISCDRLTYVDKYGVPVQDVYFRGGPSGRIGKDEDPDKWDLYDPVDLKNKLQCKRTETHLQTFIKQEYLPKRLHYANNDRIDDVILLLDDEWLVGGLQGTYTSCSGGTHGWDNENKQMRAMFVAHGASFKRAYNTSEGFDNIEIYNMICDLLDLNPAPNNGSRGSLNHMLKNPKSIVFLPSDKMPESCPYPSGSDTADDSLGCDACQGEEASNQLLNFNGEEVLLYQSQNMLMGTPEIFSATEDEDVNYCILTHHDYVTAFDWNKKMPYYAAFVLDKENREMTSEEYCIRPDIRVDPLYSATCTDFKEAQERDSFGAFLFSPAFANNYKSDATLLTNVIPVYNEFIPVWEQFAKILDNWSILYNGIYVSVGPVFDYNYDGRADSREIIEKNGTFLTPGDTTSPPMPTHVFAVVTRCRSSSSGESIRECSSSPEKITVISFLIPNYKEQPCTYGEYREKWVPNVIHEHVARVRDVELITGISFFPDWTSKAEVLQKTVIEGLRVRVHLPEFGSKWLEDLLYHVTPAPEDYPTTTLAAKLPVSSRLLVSVALLLALIGVYY